MAVNRGEGDINLGEARKKWITNELDSETREILKQDADLFLHQSLSSPCLNVLSDANGVFIKDYEGREYFDFHGNNVHQLGYKNPEITRAVKEAMEELPFSPRRYTNLRAIQLAQKLKDLSNDCLSRVLFAPGATSSIGMAMKLARIATGKFKTLSFWGSFHGASIDAISLGGEAVFREGLGPLLSGNEHIIPYDSYRPVFKSSNNTDQDYLNLVSYVLEKEKDIGAIFIETVRNTDVMVPSKKYMQGLRKLCDEHKVLLVLDETAIALGRTGKMFAYENFEIVPDMVVLGKGLGGGFIPFSALLVKEELNKAQHTSLGHYTHEKSPLGSAAALASVKYIEEHELLKHVEKLNHLAFQRLNSWYNKYSSIGDIRAIGLLFGIELVKDKKSKERAVEMAEKIMYSCMSNGLSFKVSSGNVLTLSPPLIISEQELMRALDILEKEIAKY